MNCFLSKSWIRGLVSRPRRRLARRATRASGGGFAICGIALLLSTGSLHGQSTVRDPQARPEPGRGTSSSAHAGSGALLADAAEKMDRTRVRALLTQRVDVNTPQADGMTALHWAAYQDDLEIGELLVRRRRQREGCEPVWRDAAPARLHEWKRRDGRAALECRGGPEHCPSWRRNPVDDGRAQRLAPLGEGAPVARRDR